MKEEDVWIPTSCQECYAMCGILVHRVNGEVVEIRGNPEDPVTQGRMCPKGVSGIMQLYDPNRVNTPLKRTNSQKGIGVDPRWVEISWDEALDTIVEKLKKIKEEDPRKLLVTTSVTDRELGVLLPMFATAFGSNNHWEAGTGPCGDAQHLLAGGAYGSQVVVPDLNYCNYLISFGCNPGSSAYFQAVSMGWRLAEARVRGMRHVVVDPLLSPAAAKADEWIPIRPGTDAVFALAILNILLNDLKIYDTEHLKLYTNGPYLINTKGYYLRDRETGKPLIWDAVEQRSKVYDDAIKDFALEGEYTVDGIVGRPAFSLLREHVKKFTPELASEITTVPVETVCRIAQEYGNAARVGSTIIIDGKELPYRPVSVIYYKGAEAHKTAVANCIAFQLLAEVVGARAVPGAVLGLSRCLGYPGTDSHVQEITPGPDGFLTNKVCSCWPLAEPKKPESMSLQDLITTAVTTSPMFALTMREPDKWKIPYKIEMNLHSGANYISGRFDPNLAAEVFKDMFQVSFTIFLDETTDFSDIVLPDTCFLEEDAFEFGKLQHRLPPMSEQWSYHTKQRVVESRFERRHAAEVLLELAQRVIPDEYNLCLNSSLNLKEPYKLKPGRKYTWEEIIDCRYKSLFAPDRGIEWFRKNAVLNWPRKVEEIYWKPFNKARVWIYYEHFKPIADAISRIVSEHGLPELDLSDFQPLPEWRPCHEGEPADYDLLMIWRRDILHTQKFTYEDPWLDEVSKISPYVFAIAINAGTARRKGIKDGDWVELTSASTNNSVRARAKLTEGIHPEAVAISGGGGHWAKGMPIAKGKGALFEWLVSMTINDINVPSLCLDWCVKIKLSKVKGGQE